MEGESTYRKGQKAEEAAAKWLEDHNLVILEKNWRHHHLELDIIAEGPLLGPDGNPAKRENPFKTESSNSSSFIHIVEVRSRKAEYVHPSSSGEHLSALVQPQLTVDSKKRHFLVAAADAFIRSRRISKEVVFDIVSIEFSGSSYSLSFYPDAFRPEW